jgi:hypothetical protein
MDKHSSLFCSDQDALQHWHSFNQLMFQSWFGFWTLDKVVKLFFLRHSWFWQKKLECFLYEGFLGVCLIVLHSGKLHPYSEIIDWLEKAYQGGTLKLILNRIKKKRFQSLTPGAVLLTLNASFSSYLWTSTQ